MLIDTHAHLDFPRFDNDRDKVILDAYRAGIKQVINVGADMKSSRNSVELAQEYNFIVASVGVHPHEAKSFTDQDYQELKNLASQNEVVAIGEMGLDYHYDNSPRQEQQEAFRKQLQLAQEVDLPVIIHSREAQEDTLKILKEEATNLEGVLHCFAYDLEVAREVIDLGFYVALGGVLTFGSAKDLRMVVPNLSLDRILIETDAPYLTPEPHRGERNEPKYVKEVAKKIAKLKNTNLEAVAKQTTKNAKKLFKLD
ncbi:hydrolase, TatD family [Halobacteroides halobius DSM 5150]|uniref:Hydrolase, TatD family n=1 Tax=Halobacteroides halobius (strain ATCC 35273 / DSM 5150 / MD-1) TaxID=748449 RepID=L0K6U8_HALHC|nr:TatD family hydrolase [Halobacteroides halobius]AGB40094.1 hydrolase, TatD family [Halobacteroides halobius DSM 5150]